VKLSEYKEEVGRIHYGKRLPGVVYVLRERGEAVAGRGLTAEHAEYAKGSRGADRNEFGDPLDSLLAKAEVAFGISDEFNVIKFRTDELKLSFLAAQPNR
jgi:hypothetical protein